MGKSKRQRERLPSRGSADEYRGDAGSRSPGHAAVGRVSDEATTWMLVFGAWLIAAGSKLGALFFSEVMQIPACVLCWYQRVFLFPLALLLPIGLFPFDPTVVRYGLPLAAIGWLIAVFHLLLQAGVVPEGLKPCTQGVPCSDNIVEWFGFVTIPLLSFAAFSMIIALLALARMRGSR